MLTTADIERILTAAPRQTIGVLGDLFLDRYLDIDAALTEPSLETGLDAYQVARVRSYPGAAGTVLNNLAALGVGCVVPISMIGDDGEGCELRQALEALGSVDMTSIVSTRQRRTPTYTKPMLQRPGESPRELNRLDIKNRLPLPVDVETRVIEMLTARWPTLDALLVCDQVSELDCGVVTATVRERLAELAERDPSRVVLADSRERIGLFRNVALKPNERECLRATGGGELVSAARRLAEHARRPLFCTRGEQGMLLLERADAAPTLVPAFAVKGPIDVVGAGDSSSAALACALASGAAPAIAAAFANLVASITIQQIGVTGVASPEQVRDRWRATQGA